MFTQPPARARHLFASHIDDASLSTQSGQLNAEASPCSGKVYTSSTFPRRNPRPAATSRIWMLEAGSRYVEFEEAIAGEGLVSAMCKACSRKISRAPNTQRDISKPKTVKPPSRRISYEDAGALLNKTAIPPSSARLRRPRRNQHLSSFDRPVRSTTPDSIKPFTCSGRQRPSYPRLRHERSGRLTANHAAQPAHPRTISPEAPAGTQPARRIFQCISIFGARAVPHSGLRMGLDRTVAWICGAEHIREVIPPRMIIACTRAGSSEVFPLFRNSVSRTAWDFVAGSAAAPPARPPPVMITSHGVITWHKSSLSAPQDPAKAVAAWTWPSPFAARPSRPASKSGASGRRHRQSFRQQPKRCPSRKARQVFAGNAETCGDVAAAAKNP